MQRLAASQLNTLNAEAMQYVVATLRLGESAGSTPTPLDADSRDRMLLCLRVLAGQDIWSNAVSGRAFCVGALWRAIVRYTWKGQGR